jgi:hypothetical protein
VAVLQRDHAAARQLKIAGPQESIMTHSDIRSDLRDELRNAPVEPLLPIEKKLIGWSLTIGLVLLVGLAIINHFFPATF